MRLKRIAFGPLSLNKLAEGRFRLLTGTELKELRGLVGTAASPPAARRSGSEIDGETAIRTAEAGEGTRSVAKGGRKPHARTAPTQP